MKSKFVVKCLAYKLDAGWRPMHPALEPHRGPLCTDNNVQCACQKLTCLKMAFKFPTSFWLYAPWPMLFCQCYLKYFGTIMLDYKGY